MLTSANRIIETPKIFVINAIYIPPETTKDIIIKKCFMTNKTIYLDYFVYYFHILKMMSSIVSTAVVMLTHHI